MNTRRTFLLLALTLTGALNCMAQLNGTGFYRFRNAAQKTDYISIANDKFNYHTAIATACGGLGQALSSAGQARALECAGKYLETDIHLVNDADCINPGSVIYAQKKTTNTSNYDYNLIGQGTSLLTLTTGTYDATLDLIFKDRYVTINMVSGSGENSLYSAKIELKAYNNSMANLGTRYLVDDNGKIAINESNSATNAKWYIEPVTHFNVEPEVEYEGKYYTTLYVPFAFQLSTGVEKAYVVSSINTDGSLEVVECTNDKIVPAGTPVILECSSNVASNCQLIPSAPPLFTAPQNVSNANAPSASTATNYTGTNLLKGNYYCNQDGTITFTTSSGTSTFNANHFTSPSSPQKYVLGLTESGKLGFVKATGTAMPANKAWIEYTGTSELVLPIENTTLKGDVNMDRQVNSADIVRLVDYILEKENPTPCDVEACDVNEDGDINVGDITSLVDIILNSN